MAMKKHTRLDLVEGGNIFKQGDYVTLGFIPRDYTGASVDLTNKQIEGSIFNGNTGVIYEGPASFVDGKIFFTIKQVLNDGKFQLEFTVTDTADSGYRVKFPTDDYASELTIKPSADNLDYVGVSMTTVAQLRTEQEEKQQQFELAIVPQVDELKQRVEQGIGAFTEDTEVLDARGDEPNLRSRLDKTTALLAETDDLRSALQRRIATYGYNLEKQNDMLRCVHHDNFNRADNPSEIGENSKVEGMMDYEIVSTDLLIGVINKNAYCSNYQSHSSRAYALLNMESEWIIEVVPVSGYKASVVLDYINGNNFLFSEIYPVSAVSGKIRIRTMRYVGGSLAGTINDSYIDETSLIAFERKGNTFTINGSNLFEVVDLAPSTKIGMMFGWSNDFRINNFNVYYRDKYNNLPINDKMEQNYTEYFNIHSSGKEHNFALVTDITNNSKSAWRFELRDGDGISNVGSCRSELGLKRRSLVSIDRVLVDLWTSFDVYFPNDYEVDSEPEIFYQIHDEQETWVGVTGHSPNLALLIKNDIIYLDLRSKSDKDYSTVPPRDLYELATLKKGKWMNVEIKMKARYDAVLEPSLLVLFDGEIVADLEIPNCYNTVYGGYEKFGIYKWVWASGSSDVSKRVIYFDNIKALI